MLQWKRVHKKIGRRTAVFNPPQRYFRLPLILLVLSLIVLLPSLAYAATVTKSNGTDGAVDGSPPNPLLTRTVEFTTSDFTVGGSISSVTTTVQFAKINAPDAGSCFSIGDQGGNPVNREIFMYLTSPAGTRVDLIYNAPNFTYSSNSVYGGTVTVTFDDNAATQVGGLAPTSGTFRPEESLDAFFGEDPLGIWTLTAGDGSVGDPLCFYDFSLTVNAEQAPVVDDQTFSVAEDSVNTTVVDTIVATDADAGDKLTYTVTGGSGAAVFNVGPLTGQITVADETQITTPGSFTLNVTVTDSAALSDTAVITINVTSANDLPVITEGDSTGVTMDEDGSPTAFSLTLNATDEDGDTITWSILSQGSSGTASASGTGTSKAIGYTPNANYYGSDAFVVQVNDGNGGTDSITVNVTIDPQNDNPDAVDDTPTVVEDSSNNSLNVLSNDTAAPDSGETLTITAVGPTNNGGTAINNTTNITYTPFPNFSGTEVFTYTISDGNGGSDTATVTVTVDPVNDAPNAVDDSYDVDENTTNNPLAVLGNDTNPDSGETLEITAVGPTNQGGTANNNTTNILYSPFAGFVGTEVFTYTIGDGNGLFSTATITVTVQDVNDAPIITEGTSINAADMDEDGAPTAFTPLTLNATDGDGDDRTWSIQSQGIIGTASLSGTNPNPSITVNYTPNANMNGSDSFVVRVSDGRGGIDDITVSIIVNPQNDNPDAVDDSPSVNEQSSNNTLTPLTNDTFAPDIGETLVITAVGPTNNGGTVVISTGTTLTYTPLPTFIGTEVFTYTIGDGNGGSDTATIRVSVDDVNFSPTITQGASVGVTMDEDGSPTAFSLTLNATDPDANTLTWSIHNQAMHGTATASGTGTSKIINYTPNANYNGSDSFIVWVSDGFGGWDGITVNVTINPINDAPDAVNDTKATPPETAVVINVLDNDTDPENDSLTITAVTQGSKGSVTHNSTTVTYTPNPNEAGNDSFTYTISDGNGGSDTATVTIQLGLYEVFVPLVLNNFVSAPDLVVTQVNASSTLIEVVIKNQGTQATANGFWVDFYINPSPVPTHENQLWDDLSAEGIVWGVNVAIAAGDSLTLRYSTAANAPNLYYSAVNSSYSGNLPTGTPIYAQVDSAHLNTTYGGVLETHEILGTAYNNVSSKYLAGSFTSPAAELSTNQVGPEPVDLPLR